MKKTLLLLLLVTACSKKKINLNGIYFDTKHPVFVKIDKNKLKIRNSDSFLAKYSINGNQLVLDCTKVLKKSPYVEELPKLFSYYMYKDTLNIINELDTLKLLKQKEPSFIDNDGIYRSDNDLLFQYINDKSLIPYSIKKKDTILHYRFFKLGMIFDKYPAYISKLNIIVLKKQTKSSIESQIYNLMNQDSNEMLFTTITLPKTTNKDIIASWKIDRSVVNKDIKNDILFNDIIINKTDIVVGKNHYMMTFGVTNKELFIDQIPINTSKQRLFLHIELLTSNRMILTDDLNEKVYIYNKKR